MTDQHLCSAVAGVAINVTPKLSFTTALDSASCNLPNGYAHITVAGGLTPYTYHWLPEVSDSAGAIGLSTIQYQVTIIDSNGCSVSDTFTIGGKNTVVTRPYLGKDTTICPGTDKLVLNAGSFLNYFWQDSSTQQHFMVVDTGKFWVLVTDSNGCQASDSILIGDYCSTKFVVPSAFTPNGDGKNDFFIPLYIDPPASFTMHIYDRWGDLVFQTNNVTVGWDGKFKGKEQPVGTYIYYIQYTFQGQKEQGLHGALELLR